MIIEKIILRHFIGITTAMNTKEIEIDFSKIKNKICIFIGPNGCGKTTTLSLLNPFATLGNLDVRDGNGIIDKGKNGYKEICIRNDEDLYIIKHFYTPSKDSHTVKSYIMKNGVELNDHGNVTSFKEIVKDELDVELDYMKLIRLGENVTSLIKLSNTERKNFMGKLLDEIGVFLQYYKKISADLTQLKTMISFSIDKLNKLGIEDKKQVTEEINDLLDQIETEMNSLNKLSGDLSVSTHELSKFSYTDIDSDIRTMKHKLDKMEKVLAKKGDRESSDISFYTEKINSLNNRIQSKTNEYNALTMIIKSKLNQLDDTMTSIKDLEIQLNKELESDKELNDMEEEMKTIRFQTNDLENLLDDFKTNITKREMSDFILFLQNSQRILANAYEFGEKPVSKVISLMRDNKNVMAYINSKMGDTVAEQDELLMFINRIGKSSYSEPSLREVPCGDGNCYLKELWIQMHNAVEIRKEINNDKISSEFLNYMEICFTNIKLVLPEFTKWKYLIDQFPESIKKGFLLENIYNKISKLERIYDEKALNDFMSLVTEVENLKELKEKGNQLEKDIERFNKFSNLNYVKEQLEKLKDKKETLMLEIADNKIHQKDLIEEISESQNDLESAYELKEAIESYDDVKSKYDVLIQDRESIQTYLQQTKEIQLEIHKSSMTLDFLKDKKDRLTNSLNQYKATKKELKVYNMVYDEMTLEKRALSSKEGMSLHYIEDYLGDTVEIANELLNIAYDGKIYLDKFNLTPTEFSIPYYNKGKRFSDVKLSSQGELSFLNIALSFALSAQQLTKFNIGEWDEVDGTLDVEKREKFLQIVETFIEKVNSEQNFLITHNDMFSSHYVDIVDFGFNEDNKEKYPNANFIPIVKRN